MINSSILFLLHTIVGAHLLLSAATATEVSILWNLALNDRWTFARVVRNRTWPVRTVRYNGVALVGLGISMAVLDLVSQSGVHYLLANLVAVTAGVSWNYTAGLRLVWSDGGISLTRGLDRTVVVAEAT